MSSNVIFSRLALACSEGGGGVFLFSFGVGGWALFGLMVGGRRGEPEEREV